jgi:2-polyprenyl-3-methyl-5-hydroxy-6-metoxy-1,4-benzoquinol methylase
MNKRQTKEAQYNTLFDYPETKLGVMVNQVWQDDPKRVVFVLSRYKFVAKMLQGKKTVLEIGCADAFGSRIVADAVEHLTVSDIDPLFIDSVKENARYPWQENAMVHDILSSPTAEKHDAVYCLDVFEHILPKDETTLLTNLSNSINDKGIAIIGIPSLESQQYASQYSKEGHVNCLSGDVFKDHLEKHFHHVFLFSMNDEVVHTGFSPMAHYLFALCVK